MAVTLDSILNQKPQWISVNEYVVGSTHAGVDDTILDSDGNIIQLPEGVSNRVTGQLWGHIKNLVTILQVEHNPDGTHNFANQLDDLTDVDLTNASQDNHGLFYNIQTQTWIPKESVVNIDGNIYDGGNYNESNYTGDIDCGEYQPNIVFVIDCGYVSLEDNNFVLDGNII